MVQGAVGVFAWPFGPAGWPMTNAFRKAIFAVAVAAAIAGLAEPACAQFPEPERLWKTEVAARVGLGGGDSPAGHLMAEFKAGPVRLDFDYGANAGTLQSLHTTTIVNGDMLRVGLAISPNEFLALGLRAMKVRPSGGPAAWLEVGPAARRVYVGVNDGGLASLPLQGPRLGIHSSIDAGRRVARAELAAGWGLGQYQSDWLLQGAVILAQRLSSSGFSAELAIGGASSGADYYLQAAVGLRWAGPWEPVTERAPPRRERVQPYREVLADIDAARWLGRESTWLHRPAGLAQTCTVTEAVEMGEMLWLYQTCTPSPAGAAVPWATGCYVVDADGLWRLPVCPGEAPGKLTRPVLLVPSWGHSDARFADLYGATWQERTLKLAGQDVQVHCQRVPGLQVYEACSSSAEGLLFASVRPALASDRKRWPARSTELLSLRKVVVPPVADHFGEEVSQCHWSSACRVLGECSNAGDRCAAGRHQDCAASAVCAIRGACSAAGGRCVPAAAAMCESSENCRRLGQCQLGKALGVPACVAADDSACQAAEVCAAQGLCRAERGRCVAGGQAPGEGLPAESSATGAGR